MERSLKTRLLMHSEESTWSKSRMESTVWKLGGEDMPEGWRFKRCAGKKMGIYTKVLFHRPL